MLQVTTFANQIGPAVVSLGRGARRGSGLVVAQDQVIVLSHSLASEQVQLGIAGEVRAGAVQGADRATGISLVAVATGEITPVTWAEKLPQIGEVVFALADPGTGLRVTEGRVSAAPLSLRGRSGRLIEGVEHTAPLPRGSGGGPLVDAGGAVVGLNVLRSDPGFLFAVGVAAVRPAVQRLLAGAPGPARLGVAISPPRVARRLRRAVGLPERDGVLVREVEDGSSAASAGIQRGDLIVGLGDIEVDSIDALFGALEAQQTGPTAVKLVRGIDELELPLTLDGTRR
jgi:serine protease Do